VVIAGGAGVFVAAVGGGARWCVVVSSWWLVALVAGLVAYWLVRGLDEGSGGRSILLLTLPLGLGVVRTGANSLMKQHELSYPDRDGPVGREEITLPICVTLAEQIGPGDYVILVFADGTWLGDVLDVEHGDARSGIHVDLT